MAAQHRNVEVTTIRRPTKWSTCLNVRPSYTPRFRLQVPHATIYALQQQEERQPTGLLLQWAPVGVASSIAGEEGGEERQAAAVVEVVAQRLEAL